MGVFLTRKEGFPDQSVLHAEMEMSQFRDICSIGVAIMEHCRYSQSMSVHRDPEYADLDWRAELANSEGSFAPEDEEPPYSEAEEE